MEELVERLTRGNVIEAKAVLASVALARATYRLVLIAVTMLVFTARLEERR